MPRIIIKEDELTTFAQFNATENSVLVPLFVTLDSKSSARYSNLAEFKKDFPTASVTWEEEVDTEGVYRAKVSGGVVSYWRDSRALGGDQYREIILFDKSYLMICELLAAGMPVVVKPIYHEGEFANEAEASGTIQTSIADAFAEFNDKNLWNIKFVTSGAYPNVILDGSSLIGAYTGLRAVPKDRADCIDLLEFEKTLPFDVEVDSQSSESIPTLKKVLSLLGSGNSFEAAFYPWGVYTTSAAGLVNQMSAEMPACFGYLLAVAQNALTNADWLANSGTIRGRVPNLNSLKYNIGETAMHYLQGDGDEGETADVRVNPIMPVGTYGTRIWGNRTTVSDTSDKYTNFLNVRILVCDIKKQLYHASLRVTFEPNDDIAWINFKKLNNTLLDQMQSGRGIQWYRWSKLVTDKKATLKALLTVKPIEALEYFDITVNLTDGGSVEVEEVI